MKLLFIENRYKTYFFEAIAIKLQEMGHEIHWIVQNHEFKVDVGESHDIKYPKNIQKNKINETEFSDIISSDRQLNFFGKKDKTYIPYYYKKIKEIITTIKPKFVFGEATAFHELLTIKICKEQKLLYLNLCTSRFPTGRFAFYLYDTLKPYKGSNELLKNETAITIIDEIVNRTRKPDYMIINKKTYNNKLKNKLKLLIGYFKGEIYNTPSPFVKFRKERELTKIIHYWNKIATEKTIDDQKFNVLYPMQMQPEANLDVWGRKYRNQLNTIIQIQKQLKKDELLYIKLNPKCKYELSNELITFVKSKHNVFALHVNSKMETVFNKFNLVITITGTIAIECILANKPVITLIETLNNTNKNCVFIDNFTKINTVINNIKTKKINPVTTDDKIKFVNLLTKTSFKGIVSDTFTNKNCIHSNNINLIIASFNKILKN